MSIPLWLDRLWYRLQEWRAPSLYVARLETLGFDGERISVSRRRLEALMALVGSAEVNGAVGTHPVCQAARDLMREAIWNDEVGVTEGTIELQAIDRIREAQEQLRTSARAMPWRNATKNAVEAAIDAHPTGEAIMLISRTMDLYALSGRMGTDATPTDAAVLRNLLVARFDGQDTVEIPADQWGSLLDYVEDTRDAPSGVPHHLRYRAPGHLGVTLVFLLIIFAWGFIMGWCAALRWGAGG